MFSFVRHIFCSLIFACPRRTLSALWFRKSCISILCELFVFPRSLLSVLSCILVCGLASTPAADSGLCLHFAHTWASRSVLTPILRYSCDHLEDAEIFRQWLRSSLVLGDLQVSSTISFLMLIRYSLIHSLASSRRRPYDV